MLSRFSGFPCIALAIAVIVTTTTTTIERRSHHVALGSLEFTMKTKLSSASPSAESKVCTTVPSPLHSSCPQCNQIVSLLLLSSRLLG